MGSYLLLRFKDFYLFYDSNPSQKPRKQQVVYKWRQTHQEQPEKETNHPHSQEHDLLPRGWYEHYNSDSFSYLGWPNE